MLPPDLVAHGEAVLREAIYQVGYAGYLKREQRQIDKLAGAERVKIPLDFDFLGVRGIRRESAQKLAALRPETLGQAGRVSGVSPADITVIMALLAARGGETSAIP
jgi:tRNA uridine 5-carboxymethylaminomethyl modification enzyme